MAPPAFDDAFALTGRVCHLAYPPIIFGYFFLGSGAAVPFTFTCLDFLTFFLPLVPIVPSNDNNLCFSYLENLGAAGRACSLGRRLAILEGNWLGILELPAGPALHTVS